MVPAPSTAIVFMFSIVMRLSMIIEENLRKK
jgi:hypothetical protein